MQGKGKKAAGTVHSVTGMESGPHGHTEAQVVVLFHPPQCWEAVKQSAWRGALDSFTLQVASLHVRGSAVPGDHRGEQNMLNFFRVNGIYKEL